MWLRFSEKYNANLRNIYLQNDSESKKSATFASVLTKSTSFTVFDVAELAQLVEQRIRNAWVGGSSPPFGSDGQRLLFFYVCAFFFP